MKEFMNFTKSVVAHATNGFKASTEDMQEKRMSICQQCEHMDKLNVKCNQCGCFLRVKTKWESEKCPLDKW